MARSDPLREYRAKRDPSHTPEPFGSAAEGANRLFVVQKHAARRLHYDLRLEIGGVLKSWAVPKGPSVRAHEPRLAIEVEDHPVEYADFEGIIPKGNYGAGAVIVWDRGWYRLKNGNEPLRELEAGKIELELFGVRLRGQWTLARTKRNEKEWLLLKKADAFAGTEELTQAQTTSVLSGLTLEEMRDASAKRAKLSSRLAAVSARPGRVSAAEQALMLAATAAKPFSGKSWLFEIKYDGVRVLALREKERVELYGRGRNRVTERYPEIARALKALPATSFVLDGELIALDESGRPSFQRLQQRMHLSAPGDIRFRALAVPVTGVFFDCLSLEGYDLRSLPLLKRKELLHELLPDRGVIQASQYFSEHGEALFAAAAEQRLEGIVAKKIDSPYRGGRSSDWLKIKCGQRQEFVIGGYTKPQGSRAYFGALHVGLYEDSRLVYVSKVGTGFDEDTLADVWRKLQGLGQSHSPFEVKSPSGSGHRWVTPKLVCEVRFSEWTRDGGLRQPVFVGLRADKDPRDCKREVSVSPPRALAPAPEVTITNPAKIFWPDEGLTKSDAIAYYEGIAPFILPYLKDRPLVLTRYPDGIQGKSFFQKDAPSFVPSWIPTERIYSQDAGREIDYFIVNDRQTLKYIVNLAAIPLHVWSARVDALERPDWVVLDLDPKDAPFSDVVAVALATRRVLEELEIPSYPKTSGATGLHVLVPTGRRYSHDQAKNFARLLAELVARAVPEIATTARPLKSREGKVYVDWGQNGLGKTIAAPFSLRPLPGAPVSFPLRWSEVTAKLQPRRFNLKTAQARVLRLGDPMAEIWNHAVDIPRALKLLESRVRAP
ncbi:MAG TPA: DNA ligase D [Candidatus Acidoferrales bacterium]|nr:DNA ligase D [Candidatus Acidoferrales bacterium]